MMNAIAVNFFDWLLNLMNFFSEMATWIYDHIYIVLGVSIVGIITAIIIAKLLL